MTEWTLGYIAEGVVFLAGFLGALGVLNSTLKKWLSKVMKEQTKAISDQMTEMLAHLENLDKETTKNYLVQFISEVKRGETINETERQRFYEQYGHYIDLKGNTYIKTEIEALQKKGLI